jgi:hypothetical protein
MKHMKFVIICRNLSKFVKICQNLSVKFLHISNKLFLKRMMKTNKSFFDQNNPHISYNNALTNNLFSTDLIGELCERTPNFLSTYRKIDGAEIISKNERNLDCLLTFQTHSILQRFMVRFDELKLDCNDHCKFESIISFHLTIDDKRSISDSVVIKL